MGLQIVSFEQKYAKAFYDLNIEWLETYFFVEDFDQEVLSNPQHYILDRGGNLFFMVDEMEVYGTVALMPYDNATFELTKMAVVPSARGKKIDKDLLLYSNTKLENAIHIYRKYGFVEVPVEKDSPYRRSNIKMTLTF